MDRKCEASGVLPNVADEGLCRLKRSRFSRTCFDTCVIPVRSTGLERRWKKAICRLRRPTHVQRRTRLIGRQSLKNKKGKRARTRNPGPWLCARAAALFPMLRTSLTANVRRQSQGNGALESMEALSTPTIGTNVLRARAQGSPKRLVAAFATAPAGCTPTTREGARTSVGWGGNRSFSA